MRRKAFAFHSADAGIADAPEVHRTLMTLLQLETFFWTVKLGSFSSAAQQLFTTQSTVSLRIRELERGLGVELFDRSARKAVLTPKGRELMEYATRLIDLSTEMVHRIAAPDVVAGTVRLGVAEVVSVTWLPRLIRALSERHPQVRLEMEEALTGDLIRALQLGEVEVVLAPGTPMLAQTDVRPLGSVEFAWMASPALALRPGLHGAAELAKLPVIGLKAQSFHHAAIDAWFRQAGAKCNYLARCKSMSVAASMTKAGVGISYLPLRCHREDLERGELQVIETDAPFRFVEFTASVSKERAYPLADAVAALAQELSDFDRGPGG